MYFVDTNVISEIRKGRKTNKGVVAFFDEAILKDTTVFFKRHHCR